MVAVGNFTAFLGKLLCAGAPVVQEVRGRGN